MEHNNSICCGRGWCRTITLWFMSLCLTECGNFDSGLILRIYLGFSPLVGARQVSLFLRKVSKPSASLSIRALLNQSFFYVETLVFIACLALQLCFPRSFSFESVRVLWSGEIQNSAVCELELHLWWMKVVKFIKTGGSI